MVYHAQRSYYEALLEAGVRIYLYPPPYVLHSKHFSIDDDVAVIGSSNMDMRSFALNSRCSLMMLRPRHRRPMREVEDDYRVSRASSPGGVGAPFTSPRAGRRPHPGRPPPSSSPSISTRRAAASVVTVCSPHTLADPDGPHRAAAHGSTMALETAAAATRRPENRGAHCGRYCRSYATPRRPAHGLGAGSHLPGRLGTSKALLRSPGWTRTNNPPVNSRMLCQLSYRGSRPQAQPEVSKEPGRRLNSDRVRRRAPRCGRAQAPRRPRDDLRVVGVDARVVLVGPADLPAAARWPAGDHGEAALCRATTTRRCSTTLAVTRSRISCSSSAGVGRA